ncbi:MAG: hypothetical protein FJ290_25805 [Planctomycetes bacterium]|nr:hypothetical protein [Planctomycetota bacterium]
MNQAHLCRVRRRGGFTLVELLVSVGLTAVLMWGILQLYTSATRFSATMFTEAELVAGGRAALDRMSHELAGAATLDVGYLKIAFKTDANPITALPDNVDTIQFVAPVGTDGALAHVCYQLREMDAYGNRMLHRCIKEPVSDNAVPSAPTSTSSNGFISSPLGVRVRAMTMTYVDCDSASGTPLRGTSGDSKEWRDADLADANTPRLPRAILLEIQLADNKGTISMVLSSGAYLGGSGI